MIDWMKYRFLYFLISGSVICLGIFSLIKWGVKLGIDFKGGAILEYKFEKEISTQKAINLLQEKEIEISLVQKIGKNSYQFRLGPIDQGEKDIIKDSLSKEFGKIDLLKFENVGPSIGPELVKKTVLAMLIAATTILIWVAYQFKSFKFGTCAILAMFHDSLVLLGSFALLGHFFSAEIDFLFVTAMLTILSFSVHDTIVVYDRIREFQKKRGGSLYDLANHATSETMVRSLNNSFTIIFMLVALILLGGSSIKWFAVALLIGTISGTYSSPFVAVPILVTWDELEKKAKKL